VWGGDRAKGREASLINWKMGRNEGCEFDLTGEGGTGGEGRSRKETNRY